MRKCSPFPVTVLVLAAACGGEPSGEGAAASPVAETAAAGDPVLQHFERHVAFLTPTGDSTLSVHWRWDTRQQATMVDRSISGTLARNGLWERFLSSDWTGPFTRSPWRILPRRPVRLVMGQGDAIEQILYGEAGRHLELSFGPALADWRGPTGGAIRVHEARVDLANRTSDGLLLDLMRARTGDEPEGGDWVFLASGPGLQLVLEEVVDADEPSAFRGWGRVDFLLRQWPHVEVTWTGQRPFELARRDIPSAWSLEAPEDGFSGEVTARAAHLETGNGEGPILPVRALFEVEGTVQVDDREFRVRGLWSHVQR